MSARPLSMTQEEWNAEMVRRLLRNKSNFRREQRLCRATYVGRSSFVRATSLNAVTVQEAWIRLIKEWKLHRANVARELNVSAAESCIYGFYGSKRRGETLTILL